MRPSLRRAVLLTQLGALSLAALLCALVVRNLLLAALVQAPIFATRLGPGPAKLPKPVLSASAVRTASGLDRAPPPDDSGPPPVPSGLRAHLLGTAVANHGQWSLATVDDLETHRSLILRIGDPLGGGVVVAIERRKLLVRVGDRLEELTPEDRPPGGPPVAGTAGLLRQTGAEAYELDRGRLVALLSSPSELGRLKVVPAFEDGVASGFKLFGIAADSPLAAAGFASGDVIGRVNGLLIDSPARALELYATLQQASRVEVELKRGGRVLRKLFSLR